MTRSLFLASAGAAAACAAVGRRLCAQPVPDTGGTEKIFLKSCETVDVPSLPGKNKSLVKLTTTTGAIGYCKALGAAKDLEGIASVLRDIHLLDHDTLFGRLSKSGVSPATLRIVDIACWDLHARMQGKPLHALLGTKREKALRYGDVRGNQPGFDPKRYADTVARYLQRTGLKATKLHFPGAMGTEDSIPIADVLATLRVVRETVGREPMLAWDPYPRSAESATHDVGEAKEILALMADLRYAWIEGPLPPTPFETQIPKYVELMEVAKIRVQAEGPNSSIGDGTSFEAMKRWVEAGAVNQCSTDAYIAEGLTNAKRMLDYAVSHSERRLVINLHWGWAPHAHLAMAYDESIVPAVEFVYNEEVPPSHFDKDGCLQAPDWPGIYPVGAGG